MKLFIPYLTSNVRRWRTLDRPSSLKWTTSPSLSKRFEMIDKPYPPVMRSCPVCKVMGRSMERSFARMESREIVWAVKANPASQAKRSMGKVFILWGGVCDVLGDASLERADPQISTAVFAQGCNDVVGRAFVNLCHEGAIIKKKAVPHRTYPEIAIVVFLNAENEILGCSVVKRHWRNGVSRNFRDGCSFNAANPDVSP